MKTFYLGKGVAVLLHHLAAQPKGTELFVIGVKDNQHVDVDKLPNTIVVRKLGEVVNPKYISCTNNDSEELDKETYNQHILQPAFVSLKGK